MSVKHNDGDRVENVTDNPLSYVAWKNKCEELEQQLAESHRALRAETTAHENTQMQLEKMAAENSGLKNAITAVRKTSEECEINGDELKYVVEPSEFDALTDLLDETPATDSSLAEVRAQGRNEGINFAASRLAAAFNHGFVDKPLAEVFDVVRMILDSKEELANSTLPAADGLSGEYAEKSLEEFSAQLRKGVQS